MTKGPCFYLHSFFVYMQHWSEYQTNLMGVSFTRKLLLPMLSWRAVATHANTKKKGCYWSSFRFMGCSRFCSVSKPFWFHLNLCMAAKVVLQTFSLRVGIVLVCCPQVVRFAVV